MSDGVWGGVGGIGIGGGAKVGRAMRDVDVDGL